MIRFIAAVDSKLGMATDQGIPWDLPADREYFRTQTRQGVILMGYQTYKEFDAPLHGRTNWVATTGSDPLREGFEPVADAVEFLQQQRSDVWVIGGAGLFAQTISLADELYLTRIQADYHCTKFFPQFEEQFELISQTKPQQQTGLQFHFEIWHKRA